MARRGHKRLIGIIAILLLAMGLPASTAVALEPGTDAFDRTWSRTDQPVAAGAATRTWMWGPSAFSATMYEPYDQGFGGVRVVQYFDKSRMEITNPFADSNSIWYVTNGLIAKELVTGQMQMGDNSFVPQAPANVNVAGDWDDPSGPTYSSFQGLLNVGLELPGATITLRVNRSGGTFNDPSVAQYGVTASEYVEATNHRVASVFWEFMNSTGTVYEDGQFVSDNIFENPYFATGYPITEAYWASVKVDGNYKDVLMQVFERRVLTYTPSNDPEWRVEMGNVGQHYYSWRYDTSIPTEPPAIDNADALPMGPASLGEWPYPVDGQSLIWLGNQSPYVMTVTFDGPESRVITLPPCAFCYVYPPFTEPDSCLDDIPFEEFTLAPGNYRVKTVFAAPDVTMGQDHWTLVPDAYYGSCHYVVERPF